MKRFSVYRGCLIFTVLLTLTTIKVTLAQPAPEYGRIELLHDSIAGCGSLDSSAHKKKQPNIILIFADDMGGNMDEGWTRSLFDKWNIPYQRIDVDAIKKGDLKKLDVFLIPHDSTTTLMGDKNEKRPGENKAEEEEYPEVFLPTEYKKKL